MVCWFPTLKKNLGGVLIQHAKWSQEQTLDLTDKKGDVSENNEF